MRKKIVAICLVVAVLAMGLLAGCDVEEIQGDEATLKSSAFADQGIIPAKYTVDNTDNTGISPQLSWTDAWVESFETKSFAVAVVDPDVPAALLPLGTLPGDLFIHWMIYDIPANVTSLDEGISPGGTLPSGAKELKNSFAVLGVPGYGVGYAGMAPPAGAKAHSYIFTVYALDVENLSGLTADSSYLDFTEAMAGHVIATASFTAYFGH